MSGKLIIVEGIDGSGKSELIKRLMETHGKSALFTHEPWDRPLAEKYKHKSPEEQSYYFAMDRFRHLKHVVIPALNEGLNVICDRYVYSNYAYQMYHGCGIDFIDRLQPPNIIWPDCVIHFNCDPEIAAERSEETNIERLQVIQGLYKTVYALKTESPVYCIDTTYMSIEMIFDEVEAILKQLELL